MPFPTAQRQTFTWISLGLVGLLMYLDANLSDWTATVLGSARIGGSRLLAIVANMFLGPMVSFRLLMGWNVDSALFRG